MNILDFDVHSHILPGIDDGAKDANESIELVDLLLLQGVQKIAATPHFRSHRDNVKDFLKRRENARELLYKSADTSYADRLTCGAEVAVEYGLSEIENITDLSYENSNYILLELPYRLYDLHMVREIQSIMYDHALIPVIAHVDRYTALFSREDYADLFNLRGVIFQINNEAFDDRKSRRVVKMLIDRDLPIVLGSDSHNMAYRKPNFDLSQRHMKKYQLHPEAQRFLAIF